MKPLRSTLACALGLSCLLLGRAAADETPIPIAEIKRDTPVDFEKEILPVLTKSCLACHNANTAESSLVLETPQTIAKGGDSGPAVVPGKSAESRLLVVAAHQDEPLMPPPDNEVDAVALGHLSKSKDEKLAFEDILWALVNTKEFLFNH